MKELEIVNDWELTPDDECKELEKRDDVFVFYCTNCHTTWVLKEKRPES